MVTLLSLYWPWEELEANGYYHYIDILLLNDALELEHKFFRYHPSTHA